MSRVADSNFSAVHIGEQPEEERLESEPERPFRVLITGDFSGRSWREKPVLSLAPKRVDRDNFDDVLNAMQVALNLHGLDLRFHELEDFHADRIYQNCPLFQNLDQYLKQSEVSKANIAAAAAPRPAASGSLLDQMVDEQDPAPDPAVSVEDANDLASFIQRVTKGHLQAKPDPAQQERVAKQESIATELLQGILHHPRLQALEAAWRGAFLLIRGLDTDEAIELYLLDITLPELVGNLATVQKELRRKGQWGLIAGNYTFGQSDLDAQVLQRLSAFSSSLGAPFIAEGKLPGDSDAGKMWEDFRHSSEATWIGLALPRFLLRLPYGKETSPLDSFPFEEMPVSEHSAYLWGNPAFACVYLLGKSFMDRGWDMGRLERRIEGLPLHVYREDDEPVAKPCAEVWMTEKDANTLLDEGFMPLASLKHEAAAMIVRFQSVAKPLAPLAGLQ